MLIAQLSYLRWKSIGAVNVANVTSPNPWWLLILTSKHHIEQLEKT